MNMHFGVNYPFNILCSFSYFLNVFVQKKNSSKARLYFYLFIFSDLFTMLKGSAVLSSGIVITS